MNTGGLALEQAPPISVPMRFFLTAPLFGVAAGLLLLVMGPDLLLNRWTPGTLAATHLLTLGWLGLVMCGATTQMLPVVAGSPVPGVRWVSVAVHLLVSAGTVLLCAGFLTGASGWLELAGVTLGAGFALFITALIMALTRVGSVTPTVTGMRLALGALLVTVALGLVLLASLGGALGLSRPLLVTDIHLRWGLLGWIGWLVIGVSYQVVPMFQMTPEYPRWMARLLLPGLFATQLAWTALMVVDGGDTVWTRGVQLLQGMGYGLFAAVTLWLQWRRKRRLPDVTLLFWRIGMVILLIGLLIGLGLVVVSEGRQAAQTPLLLGVMLLPGVALSVAIGMLYKIVPFLCWFHLQHRKIMAHPRSSAVKIPNMKEFMPDRLVRRQLGTHLLSLLMLIAAVWLPQWLARPAGLVFALSMGLLWWNLGQAMLHFRRVSCALDTGS